MIKKIFFTLLIILASSNVSFAKSNDEVDGKNNNKINAKNLNEAKSEPHFDLPKKDAKEQCEEVERVIDTIMTQNESIYDGPGVYNFFDKEKEKFIAYSYDSFLLMNENEEYLNKSFILIYDIYKKKYLAMPDKIHFSNIYQESGFLYQKTIEEDSDGQDYIFTKTRPKNFKKLIKFNGCLIQEINFNY
jgi:hypothetical protein